MLATHLINEIDNFIDRAVILKNGKIKRDCLIDEIRAEGKTLEEVMREACGYDEESANRRPWIARMSLMQVIVRSPLQKSCGNAGRRFISISRLIGRIKKN